jgi:hypothetical protein
MTLDSEKYIISPPLNDFSNLGLHTVTYIAKSIWFFTIDHLSFKVNVVNDAP